MREEFSITKAKILLMILCVVMLLLLLVKVTIIGQLAPQGDSLARILARRDEIERENEELRVQLLELESYQHILEAAKHKGFVQATDKSYMIVQ